MRTLLKGLAFAAAFAVAGPAFAADMPLKAPPPVVPAFTWTGWYVGLTAGGEWGSSDPRTSTIFDPAGYFATTSVPAINATGAQHISSHGATVGAELGYNWQAGMALWGVETDFSYFGLKGSATNSALYPCCAPTGFTINSTMKTDWLFTLRPRVGLAANRWLLYVTGGLAVADVKANFTFTDTFATALETGSISATRAGWVAGLGGEYAFTDRLSLKLEWLHLDLGRVSTTSTNLTAFAPPIAFPTNVFTHSINLQSDIVRAGVNFRL
jgi:outer membrane immunogenic protein